MRISIAEGYLPDEWHEQKDEVVETATGYLSLSTSCVEIDGCYYHQEQDEEYLVFDQEHHRYILEEDSILVYDGQTNCFYTTARDSDRYYEYQNEYYTAHGLGANNLVVTSCGSVALLDDVYYWESDGEYHYEAEDDDEDDDGIWDYDYGPYPPDYRSDANSPGIGFEVEKGGAPEFCGYFDKEELYRKTGCVIERDSSVDWELKTPVYPLFSNDIETVWLDQIREAVDAENHEDAGGHIHLSMPPKDGKELFDYCRPYLPLFMAMYPTRLENHYCQARTEYDLKTGGKYQAIKFWENRIELRFPAKVANTEALLFRLNFCRQMIEHRYKSILATTMAVFDTKTALHQLVMSQYAGKEYQLLERVTSVALKYFNTDLRKEKSIESLVKTLKTVKPCVLQS